MRNGECARGNLNGILLLSIKHSEETNEKKSQWKWHIRLGTKRKKAGWKSLQLITLLLSNRGSKTEIENIKKYATLQ